MFYYDCHVELSHKVVNISRGREMKVHTNSSLDFKVVVLSLSLKTGLSKKLGKWFSMWENCWYLLTFDSLSLDSKLAVRLVAHMRHGLVFSEVEQYTSSRSSCHCTKARLRWMICILWLSGLGHVCSRERNPGTSKNCWAPFVFGYAGLVSELAF